MWVGRTEPASGTRDQQFVGSGSVKGCRAV